MFRTLSAIAACAGISSGCNATAPSCTDQYGRGATALNALDVSCTSAPTDLQCQSIASIKDLYVYCPKQEVVTAATTWTAGDPSIVSVVSPGVIRAVGTGDTFIRATWQGIQSEVHPVSVFPGMPPRRTREIFGSVYLRGSLPRIFVNGAVIEILDGVVAGRSAVSGVHPPLLPGYLGPFGSDGYYRLLGVPPGTYRLRMTRAGDASQEREVVVTDSGGALAEFQIDPRP